MKTRSALLLQFSVVILVGIYSLLEALRMPDRVPTHWDIHGQIDGYGSRWMTAFMMPGIMLAMIGIGLVLPAISPRQFRIDEFRRTYNYVLVVMQVLFGAIQWVIVQTTLNVGFDVMRAMTLAMFLSFVFIGNVIGKTRRNFFIGVRTPWTLADERVWIETHRSAGRLWVAGSLIGIVLALTPIPVWIDFSYFMAIALWPVVQSFFIYRRVVGA